MEKPRLSFSRTSTFLHCRKRYDWIYNQGLILKKKPLPLQVGDIVHQLFHLNYQDKLPQLEKLNEWVQQLYPDNEEKVSLDVAIQAANLFVGYLRKYEDDPLTLVSSEVHLEFDTGPYILYGKIDGLVRTKDERLWRLERKTTSAMDSFFLNGLKTSLQAGIYDYLLEKTFDEVPYGTIYDILVKTKVPQYGRNPLPRNRRIMERALQTLEGVCRDLKRKEFYPSCECFTYSRECDYSILCNFDSPDARESFYQTIPEEERR